MPREARGGLLGATALVGLVLSAWGAFGVSEFLEARGREVEVSGLMLRFGAGWALWVPLVLPVVWAWLWLWRRGGPWYLALVLQLVLSGVVGSLHAWVNEHLQDGLSQLLADEETEPRDRWEGRGPSSRPTDEARAATGAEVVADQLASTAGAGEVAVAVDATAGLTAPAERATDEDGATDREADGATDGDRDRGGERRSSRWSRRDSGFFSNWFDPRRQLSYSLMQYWLVVALGAGLVGSRRARSEERRAVASQLTASRAQAGLVQAQLEALRAQVHPHFLFNALHTVGGLVREQREGEALAALSGLGDLLRAALRRGPDRQETSLDDELELVAEYLALERLRFGERLNHELRQDPGTGALSVPCLCLLPLVENAVRYAVEPRAAGGTLIIEAARDGDDGLVLSVRDDGPGFPADVLARGSGGSGDREQVGLANTARRLTMLYGDAGRLVLDNPPEGGARVTLHLPGGVSRR